MLNKFLRSAEDIMCASEFLGEENKSINGNLIYFDDYNKTILENIINIKKVTLNYVKKISKIILNHSINSKECQLNLYIFLKNLISFTSNYNLLVGSYELFDVVKVKEELFFEFNESDQIRVMLNTKIDHNIALNENSKRTILKVMDKWNKVMLNKKRLSMSNYLKIEEIKLSKQIKTVGINQFIKNKMILVRKRNLENLKKKTKFVDFKDFIEYFLINDTYVLRNNKKLLKELTSNNNISILYNFILNPFCYTISEDFIEYFKSNINGIVEFVPDYIYSYINCSAKQNNSINFLSKNIMNTFGISKSANEKNKYSQNYYYLRSFLSIILITLSNNQDIFFKNNNNIILFFELLYKGLKENIENIDINMILYLLNFIIIYNNKLAIAYIIKYNILYVLFFNLKNGNVKNFILNFIFPSKIYNFDKIIYFYIWKYLTLSGFIEDFLYQLFYSDNNFNYEKFSKDYNNIDIENIFDDLIKRLNNISNNSKYLAIINSSYNYTKDNILLSEKIYQIDNDIDLINTNIKQYSINHALSIDNSLNLDKGTGISLHMKDYYIKYIKEIYLKNKKYLFDYIFITRFDEYNNNSNNIRDKFLKKYKRNISLKQHIHSNITKLTGNQSSTKIENKLLSIDSTRKTNNLVLLKSKKSLPLINNRRMTKIKKISIFTTNKIIDSNINDEDDKKIKLKLWENKYKYYFPIKIEKCSNPYCKNKYINMNDIFNDTHKDNAIMNNMFSNNCSEILYHIILSSINEISNTKFKPLSCITFNHYYNILNTLFNNNPNIFKYIILNFMTKILLFYKEDEYYFIDSSAGYSFKTVKLLFTFLSEKDNINFDNYKYIKKTFYNTIIDYLDIYEDNMLMILNYYEENNKKFDLLLLSLIEFYLNCFYLIINFNKDIINNVNLNIIEYIVILTLNNINNEFLVNVFLKYIEFLFINKYEKILIDIFIKINFINMIFEVYQELETKRNNLNKNMGIIRFIRRICMYINFVFEYGNNKIIQFNTDNKIITDNNNNVRKTNYSVSTKKSARIDLFSELKTGNNNIDNLKLGKNNKLLVKKVNLFKKQTNFILLRKQLLELSNIRILLSKIYDIYGYEIAFTNKEIPKSPLNKSKKSCFYE